MNIALPLIKNGCSLDNKDSVSFGTISLNDLHFIVKLIEGLLLYLNLLKEAFKEKYYVNIANRLVM